MNAKQLFATQTALHSFLAGVVHDPRFEQCLLYAQQHTLDEAGAFSPDFHRGMRSLSHALQTLADEEPAIVQFPQSGLNHDWDKQPEPKK